MAWGKIANNLKNELVKTRSQVGLQRQPELSDDFVKLMSLLEQRAKNPFDEMDKSFFDELNACCSNFKEGGHWKPGDWQNKHPYFYRIESMESFVRKHKYFFHQGFDTPDALFLNTDRYATPQLFQIVTEDYLKKRSWHNLSRLTTQYYCYRGFSWWTNDYTFEDTFPSSFDGVQLTTDNEWLLTFAFKVGISSDWLSKNMLFIRLDSRKMNFEDIRIPSIIDALLQPIFSPRAFNESQRWGLAFDLNQSIQPVYKEFVVRNIPVDAIDYIPVSINLDTLDKINPNARLNDLLVNALIQNI